MYQNFTPPISPHWTVVAIVVNSVFPWSSEKYLFVWKTTMLLFQECVFWTALTELGKILLHLQIDFFKWHCPYWEEVQLYLLLKWRAANFTDIDSYQCKIHMNFNSRVTYQHPLCLKSIWQCVHDCTSQRIFIPFKHSPPPQPHTLFWCNKNLDWGCSDLNISLFYSWNDTFSMLPNATFFTSFFHVWLWILVERYYWDT